MNYIYCPSYTSIFLAFHIKNSGEDVKIITHNESISRFCEYVNMDFILFDYYHKINFSVRDIVTLLRRKSYLDNLFRSIDPKRDDTLYFVGNIADFSLLYLVKKWTKKGTVYYTELLNQQVRSYDRQTDHFSKRKYYNAKKDVLFVWTIFGLNLKLYEFVQRTIRLGFDQKFAAKYRINYVDFGGYSRLVHEAIDNSSIKIKSYDTLILTGYPHKDVEFDILEDLYGKILRMSSSIAVKTHPAVTHYDKHQRDARIFFKGFDLLPSFLPAELLLKSIKKNVVSKASTALLAAAEMDHLRSICIMDLVEWREKKKIFKEQHKLFLKESSEHKIIFVQNLEQLSQILRS